MSGTDACATALQVNFFQVRRERRVKVNLQLGLSPNIPFRLVTLETSCMCYIYVDLFVTPAPCFGNL